MEKEGKKEIKQLGSKGCDQWHKSFSWSSINNVVSIPVVNKTTRINTVLPLSSDQDAGMDRLSTSQQKTQKRDEGLISWLSGLPSRGTWIGWENGPTWTS